MESEQQEKSDNMTATPGCPALLSPELERSSMSDIQDSLPSRSTCDRLVSRYFQSKDPATSSFLVTSIPFGELIHR